jgi:uncharacterized protein (DUF885 family)
MRIAEWTAQPSNTGSQPAGSNVARPFRNPQSAIRNPLTRIVAGVAALLACAGGVVAQTAALRDTASLPGWADDPPVLSTLVQFARQESDLRVAVERYTLDQAAIRRRYDVEYSPVRQERLRHFSEGWQQRLAALDFDALNPEGRIDYILLRNRITFDQATLRLDDQRWTEIAPFVPFADRLRTLQEARYDRRRADPRETAGTLDQLAQQAEQLTRELAEAARKAGGPVTRPGVTPTIALRAARYVERLKEVVEDFNRFYSGYDPVYTWWCAVPYARLEKAFTAYAGAVREHLGGVRPGEPAPIVGDPVLAEGLRAHLAVEMIPYSAEELIAIGWKEFEWVENQLKIVSRSMGKGDDWKAALEQVKTLAPPPGEKPWVILEIARYSRDFIERLDAVTVPPLAEEVWRLAMQTPERQRQNPFFTGGEVTRVSYPTAEMTHEDKLMSMRGNTPPFNFATVHHELIPGHHLQAVMSRRFNAHRGEIAGTPFWGEGWALYWELLLWDRNFPRNDAERIGMLFWRLHRAARIVFSLNFQLGKWSPQQAVDFLVDRVGHERANAEAEVRRSVEVAAPLYQVAYLVGGLQFRALYQELVESGRMTARQYHDAVLQGGRMPVEMVRARLTGQRLTRDERAQWRFYR